MITRQVPRGLTPALISASLLVAAGCHSSALPKTYTVNGTVAYKGGQPMKGGSVQFTSENDPSLRVVGQIRDDGTFTLETIRDAGKSPGAPEGEYQVTVLPPLRGEHRGVPPIPLQQRYKVEAGEGNRCTIELKVSPPGS